MQAQQQSFAQHVPSNMFSIPPQGCIAHSSTGSPGLLQRLGRVLKDKAAGDFDRFFKGTSKTRERLGVSHSHCPISMQQAVLQQLS
jgi:hypothetical protein